MSVRTVVVDDEPVARTGLVRHLKEVDWIEVVGEAANGPDAVTTINTLRPDLVFLDIQMPGLLGTEAVRRLTHHPYVVFVTAHAQHAVTAFELGALDYVLKPFGENRLALLLNRLRTALEHPAAVSGFGRFQEVSRRGPLERLFVRCGDTIRPVPVAGVLWFEAHGDYVIAQETDARHTLRVSLTRLEGRLDGGHFMRIHRTHIVNLDHVVAFRRVGKGRLAAELTSGRRLMVSRNRAAAVRALGL